MPTVGGGAPGGCGSRAGGKLQAAAWACKRVLSRNATHNGRPGPTPSEHPMQPRAGCFPPPLVQSSPVLLGASKLGHPTWQPPDEGEHGALQVPPEDGQPLLQPCWAHFTLALRAVHLQGGLVLVHRNGHNVLLAVTDLDLHQDQGDALHGQDDQLWGEACLSRGRAGGVAAKCPRALLSCPVLRASCGQGRLRPGYDRDSVSIRVKEGATWTLSNVMEDEQIKPHTLGRELGGNTLQKRECTCIGLGRGDPSHQRVHRRDTG